MGASSLACVDSEGRAQLLACGDGFQQHFAVPGEYFLSRPEAKDAIAAHNLADIRRIVGKYRFVVQTHNDKRSLRSLRQSVSH